MKFPEFPPVTRPLVWDHPISGRRLLNLSPLHAVGIVGMEEKESDALVAELVAHVTRQAFSFVHHWQVDDMVLWDNWRTLHSTLGYPLGQKRVVPSMVKCRSARSCRPPETAGWMVSARRWPPAQPNSSRLPQESKADCSSPSRVRRMLATCRRFSSGI